ILPAGPIWMYKEIHMPYSTKIPIHLYYQDPLKCLESLLQNPPLKDYLHYSPFCLYKKAGNLMRVYTEWLSGDSAWDMQNKLPSGATLLGTILFSDKTNISAMTGGRVAHPLLISSLNIFMDFWNKASNHAFLLLALLPIPKFLHQKPAIHSLLESQLFHECLDIVLAPLKKAAEIGAVLSDSVGSVRCSITLQTLSSIEETVDPWDLDAYKKAASSHQLNGVHRPETNMSLKGPFPEPVTGLHLLKKTRRTNRELFGDILPLGQIRDLVDLVLKMGAQTNRRFTKENALQFAEEVWLNKFFDKEHFFSLS
ncbi:hypothetical protein AN958_12599, partial [Leucoagaricus sp. SymC.cos]